MQVAIHPDENFLHEIFGFFAIADRAIYEVQETDLITLDQLRKGSFFPTQECRDDG
jgi:hypothetical protein